MKSLNYHFVSVQITAARFISFLKTKIRLFVFFLKYFKSDSNLDMLTLYQNLDKDNSLTVKYQFPKLMLGVRAPLVLKEIKLFVLCQSLMQKLNFTTFIIEITIVIITFEYKKLDDSVLTRWIRYPPLISASLASKQKMSRFIIYFYIKG